MRKSVSVLLAVTLAAGLGGLRTARTGAQTVTPDQLPAAALSTFDLSGYQNSQDGNLMAPRGFAAAFLRTFYTSDNGGSIFIDALLAPGPELTPALLRPLVANGTVFQGFRDAGSAPLANYTLTGPLGFGDFDQSAAWDAFDAQTQTWDTRYADAFVRDGVLAVLIYVAPHTTADSGALAGLAALQDQKLQTIAGPASAAAITLGTAPR